MITKSAAIFVKKQTAKQANLSALVQAPHRRFAGGGPKKAAMPATETDFDIVVVGKIPF
jgi:hypothetical protein